MRAFMYASGRNVWKRSTKNDILRERSVGRPRRGRGRGRGPAGAPPGGDDAQALDERPLFGADVRLGHVRVAHLEDLELGRGLRPGKNFNVTAM